MKATKLTTAPDGFEYYRVCDQEGVCRVVRGMWAAQHLIEDMPELTATRTKLYPAEWSLSPESEDMREQLWQELHRVGWQQVDPCWGVSAEP